MNWYWIDRFTVFESGTRAQAIKTITRAEEQLRDHFPFHPVMPMSLIIEGIAQTAGLLIHEAKDFQKKVILGKVPKLEIEDTELIPGDCLVYDIKVDYIHEEGSMVSATITKDGRQIGSGTLVFAHLGEGFQDQQLYGEEDLYDLVRAFGVYDVGVDADGKPLVDPIYSKTKA